MKQRRLLASVALAMMLTLLLPNAMAFGSEPGSDPMGIECGEQPTEGVVWYTFGPGETPPEVSFGLTAPGTFQGSTYRDQLDDASKAIYDVLLQQLGSGRDSADFAGTGAAAYLTSPPLTYVEYEITKDGNTYPSIEAEDGVYVTHNEGGFDEWLYPLAASAYLALTNDHPELPWLGAESYGFAFSMDQEGTPLEGYPMPITGKDNEEYEYSATSYTGVTVTVTELTLNNIPDVPKAAFDSAVSDAISGVNAKLGIEGNTASAASGRDRYEVVKAIHDYVCDLLTYDLTTEAPFNQTAYSGLVVPHQTVCAGYAKSFKVLCDQYGVPCVLVSGQSRNRDGAFVNHEWNDVQMEDGKWYAVDCTWDDQQRDGQTGDEGIYTDYLLSGSLTADTHFEGEPFDATHIASGTWTASVTFPYPILNETAYVQKISMPTGRIAIYADEKVITDGRAAVGDQLRAEFTSDTGSLLGELTYTWYYEDEAEPLGTGEYTVKEADAGKRLIVRATSEAYLDGAESGPVTIRKPMAANMVELSETSFDYNGESQIPEVTVKDGSAVLRQSEDYRISYHTDPVITSPAADTVHAGTIYVFVEGMGNYSGDACKPYTIAPTDNYHYTHSQTAATISDSYPPDGTASASGVNDEIVTGALTWFTDEACTVPAAGGRFDTAGIQTLYWKFTPSGNPDYVEKTGETQFTVSSLPTLIVHAAAPGAKTYGDAAFGLHVTVTASDGEVTPELSYTADNGGVVSVDGNGQVTIHKAGTATVTVTATAAGHAEGTAEVTLQVAKRKLTVTNAAFDQKTFDGTTDAVVSGVDFSGLVGADTLTDSDYTAAAAFQEANAGESKAVDITIELDHANYEMAQEKFTVNSGTILKAAKAVDAVDSTLTRREGCAVEIDLSDYLPDDHGSAAPVYQLAGGTYAGLTAAINGSRLVLTYAGGTAGTRDTVHAVITGMTNYSDISVEVNVSYEEEPAPPPVVDPTPVRVTGVTVSQSAMGLTVGQTGTLTATVIPGNADNRSVIWSSSDSTIASVSGGVVTGLRAGTAIITVTTVDGSYAASCTITVTAPSVPGGPGGSGGTPVAPVTPVVPNPGAPGNPSSSHSNNNTGDTNTPSTSPSTSGNAPVVPETTVSGGTATAEVTGEQASQLVEQAASGNSTVVIAPEINGDVTRTEVSIPASAVSGIAGSSNAELKVEMPAASITISNRGLAGLGSQNITVAAGKTGNTVSVEVTAGGRVVESVSGGVKAEIPVQCGPGTVAQVVDENGSVLSTVRKSFATDGGQTMSVPLDGSAKVVFADNGKSFADVPAGNWASNAVAFASGHELMNGVSAASFSPSEPMTRSMLAVVLHNLEGNPSTSHSGGFGDASSSAWYAQAVQWAADNSIVTGVSEGIFAPDASITREQLVVMLYRYAGQPAAGGNLGAFSDAASVSAWARQAMAWAVSNGIINGANGALNPQGGATRAEVAQMLMNFVTSGAI